MHLKSDHIHIFPLAKERNGQHGRESRMFYEDNIANIVRQVTDCPSFVITRDPQFSFEQLDPQNPTLYSMVAKKDFQFTLFGYFIKVVADGVLCTVDVDGKTDETIPLYAILNYSTTAKEVAGQDNRIGESDDFNYTGVSLEHSVPTGTDPSKCLKLCDIKTEVIRSKREFAVTFPSLSYLKFDNNSTSEVKILRIDGKRS